MRISMEPPTKRQEIAILERFRDAEPLQSLEAVCTKEEIASLQESVRKIYVHPALMEYLAGLSQASREFRNVELGVSPRGTLALLRASQAYALAGKGICDPGGRERGSGSSACPPAFCERRHELYRRTKAGSGRTAAQCGSAHRGVDKVI